MSTESNWISRGYTHFLANVHVISKIKNNLEWLYARSYVLLLTVAVLGHLLNSHLNSCPRIHGKLLLYTCGIHTLYRRVDTISPHNGHMQ